MDSADELAVLANQTASAVIANHFDFNRDGVVDAADGQIALNNQSGFALNLITVPALPQSRHLRDLFTRITTETAATMILIRLWAVRQSI